MHGDYDLYLTTYTTHFVNGYIGMEHGNETATVTLWCESLSGVNHSLV